MMASPLNHARQKFSALSVVRLRAYGATAGQPSTACAEPPASERRLERETGFEPATSTLARSHSTTELFPPVQDHGPASAFAQGASADKQAGHHRYFTIMVRLKADTTEAN